MQSVNGSTTSFFWCCCSDDEDNMLTHQSAVKQPRDNPRSEDQVKPENAAAAIGEVNQMHSSFQPLHPDVRTPLLVTDRRPLPPVVSSRPSSNSAPLPKRVTVIVPDEPNKPKGILRGVTISSEILPVSPYSTPKTPSKPTQSSSGSEGEFTDGDLVQATSSPAAQETPTSNPKKTYTLKRIPPPNFEGTETDQSSRSSGSELEDSDSDSDLIAATSSPFKGKS